MGKVEDYAWADLRREVDLWWLEQLRKGPDHMRKIAEILNEPFEDMMMEVVNKEEEG